MSKPRNRRLVAILATLILFAITVPATALPFDPLGSVSFLARFFNSLRAELTHPGTQERPFVAYLSTQIEPNGDVPPGTTPGTQGEGGDGQ